MRVWADGMTDVGLCRQNNEDSFGIDAERSLFTVADGVGGQPAGEVASRLVTDRLPQAVAELVADQTDSREILGRAVRKVNADLLETASQRAAWRGMSTTVATAWFRSGDIVVANVGDSRVYLVREQDIDQISEEHTVLAEQQRDGLVESATADRRTAHILTRCLGIDSDINVYTEAIPAQAGDRILLCSDGLSDCLSPEVIRSVVLSASTPAEGCRMLIELANRNGGHDNITALLIYFDEAKLKTGLAKLMGRRS